MGFRVLGFRVLGFSGLRLRVVVHLLEFDLNFFLCGRALRSVHTGLIRGLRGLLQGRQAVLVAFLHGPSSPKPYTLNERAKVHCTLRRKP